MIAELQNAEPARVVPPASRDRELIGRILAGERELFHELVRPYERSVYYVALPILHNEQEAEDAAQETMLKALKNLHSFRAESKFSTWLISIAVNEARARLRHGRVLRFESVEQAAKDERGGFTAATTTDLREIRLQTLERKELGQILQHAMASLPEIYREVLQLRDLEELSTAETAALLGVSKGAVKTRLLRARLMMQKIVYRSCRMPHTQVQNATAIAERRSLPDKVSARRSKGSSAHLCQQAFGSWV